MSKKRVRCAVQPSTLLPPQYFTFLLYFLLYFWFGRVFPRALCLAVRGEAMFFFWASVKKISASSVREEQILEQAAPPNNTNAVGFERGHVQYRLGAPTLCYWRTNDHTAARHRDAVSVRVDHHSRCPNLPFAVWYNADSVRRLTDGATDVDTAGKLFAAR